MATAQFLHENYAPKLVLQATGIKLILKKSGVGDSTEKAGVFFIPRQIGLQDTLAKLSPTVTKIEKSNSSSYLLLVRESIPPEARWSNVKLAGLNSSCSNREAKIWIVHPWVRSVSSI